MSKVTMTAVFKPVPAPNVSHLPLLDPTELPPTVLMRTLAKALTMRRDHGSATEAEFVAWLANRLPITMIDGAGNIHVDRRASSDHLTLFTSHTDSVHRGGGPNAVRVDGDMWRADGAALGADDGAGIALMCHMLDHGVPGYYIFFRGEECGGVGSSWLAENMPDLLSEFGHAVAFDRAGYSDVITHQGMGRCCSDKFAQALSDQLNDNGMLYMPDDSGVYTDTAEFVDLIPECTNLSVGYKHQHGDREEQDVAYLVRLADALVRVDWSGLPVSRDPNAHVSRWPWTLQTTHGPEDFGLEGEELMLYAAIEKAYDGDFRALSTLIDDYLAPGHPGSALHYFRADKLSNEALDDALEALEQYWAVSEVLDDLVSKCTTL